MCETPALFIATSMRPKLLLSVLTTYGAIIGLTQLFRLAWGKGRRRLALANFSLVFSYLLLWLYHFHAHTSIDYALISDNFSEAFSAEGLLVMRDAAGIGAWFGLLCLLLAVAAFEWRFCLLSRGLAKEANLRWSLLMKKPAETRRTPQDGL